MGEPDDDTPATGRLWRESLRTTGTKRHASISLTEPLPLFTRHLNFYGKKMLNYHRVSLCHFSFFVQLRIALEIEKGFRSQVTVKYYTRYQEYVLMRHGSLTMVNLEHVARLGGFRILGSNKSWRILGRTKV